MSRAGCSWRRRAQRGQAMAEYVILVFWLTFFLFTPMFPHPDGGRRLSVMMLFTEVFDIYINSFHTVIAMPVP